MLRRSPGPHSQRTLQLRRIGYASATDGRPVDSQNRVRPGVASPDRTFPVPGLPPDSTQKWVRITDRPVRTRIRWV
ncbi:protein of unknown function [Cupriavidus taiwanensis]|nr:protein of unknown function [Cupriavidus taiwanensis]SOZ11392.1 protein of unknown function [Cupriavidus taiwanensis]SOZ42745.1 protein of unknown function [Cupriavidus taiwanensis]